MTEKQHKRFYLAAWNRCANARDWRTEKGRFTGRMIPQFGVGTVRELYTQVWTAAHQLALTDHRAIKPDDFRHACHIVALGRDKGSKDFTSAECDRVVTLFKMLTEPDDIDAQIDWDHPENAALRRLKWAIEHSAPDPYVRAIAADKFGTKLWEDLEPQQLRYLMVTLNERRRRKATSVAATAEANPF
jgi:hypothetical protein